MVMLIDQRRIRGYEVSETSNADIQRQTHTIVYNAHFGASIICIKVYLYVMKLCNEYIFVHTLMLISQGNAIKLCLSLISRRF